MARGKRSSGKPSTLSPDSFETRYPNIAAWVQDGGIEIGCDDCSRSFVRALDIGGIVWEGGSEYPTLDAALRDTIDHALLLSLVARRSSDRRVLTLIRQWLKAGVGEQGQWQPREVGSPHGGVISPLLANIYWHVLDMYWGTRYAGLGARFRYADDMVMICRTKLQAQHAFHAVPVILQKLKRQLHPPKTRLVAMAQEGFDFLGFHCHKLRAKHTGKLLPSIGPGQKAMKARRWEIHGLTSRQRGWQRSSGSSTR